MRLLIASTTLALAASLCAGTPGAQPLELRLGTKGAAFTVNGEPRFLVLVSYFDAMDATALDADLSMLAKSVDGIRMFANWWDMAAGEGCRNAFSPGTLFGPGAGGRLVVRPERLARLKQVLARARVHGLIVDLTFAADPVAGASKLASNDAGRVCPPAGFRNEVNWAAVAAAVGETAAALSSPEFDHVFFDVQNEAGHDFNRAGREDLRRLVDAVRKASPRRLVSVSMFDPDADRQAAMVKDLGLSMLNFHDARGDGWGARTAGHVTRFREAVARAGLDVPVYAGEPDAGAYGHDVAEFKAAVTGARSAGAGAWTFHTRVAYDLKSASLDQRLDPLTRRVLGALRGWLGR